MNRRNENPSQSGYGQRPPRSAQDWTQDGYRTGGRNATYDDELEMRNEDRSRNEYYGRGGYERNFGGGRGGAEDYEAGRGMSTRGPQGNEAWGYGDYDSERQMGGRGYGGYGRGAYESSYGTSAEGYGQSRQGGIHGRSDYGPSAGYPREGFPGRYGSAGYEEQSYGNRPRGYGQAGGSYGQAGYSQSGGYGQGSGMYNQSGYDAQDSMPGYAGSYGNARSMQGGRMQYPGGQQAGDFGQGYYGNARQGGGSGGGYGGGYSAQGGMGGYGEMGDTARHRSLSGRGPKGYTRSDDRLKEDICERLTDDPRIDASDVSIEVRDGKVTLTGQVDQRATKHDIEDLVDRCSGVKDIDNRLTVSSASRSGQSGSGSGGSNFSSSSGGGSSASFSSSEGDTVGNGRGGSAGGTTTSSGSTKKN